MFKELDEMSVGQKLYDYECMECDFQKGLPEFLLDEFRFDMIFSQATASEEDMPILECPMCGNTFAYKNADNR